jgi:hypothetical protein
MRRSVSGSYRIFSTKGGSGSGIGGDGFLEYALSRRSISDCPRVRQAAIEEHDVPDPLREPVGGADDGERTITMRDQDHVLQVVAGDHVADLADVIGEGMGFLIAECRCEGGVAVGLEERDRPVPAAGSEPAAGRVDGSFRQPVPGVG